MLLNTFGQCFLKFFSTSSRTFNEFDANNNILFQIKVFGGKNNGTKLSMYLIKTTEF